MDEDDETVDTEMSARVRPLDWAIVGVGFARRLVGAVYLTTSVAEQLLMSHANYLAELGAFADQMRMEIESLTQED